MTVEGDALILEITATGAKLKLEPWDGDVFTARMMPLGRFAAIAEDLGPLPMGFVQFQIDKDGKAQRASPFASTTDRPTNSSANRSVAMGRSGCN